MTANTHPHHHDPTTHRRMRDAMGPGYQVAIFREASPFTATGRRTHI